MSNYSAISLINRNTLHCKVTQKPLWSGKDVPTYAHAVHTKLSSYCSHTNTDFSSDYKSLTDQSYPALHISWV
jgi:hypothetical protein